ncbi:dTDP-4-dehydrorhamnose reductase [Apibacter sp. B3889]|uniref:dTDP-4-dehydrorhamnose reductase n=1 Tax=unclassified Apibacter TaxID=2630820 RepID=UPI00132120BA|nr:MULTISPECIES: dTDP-4-dehydrorhamnose reductase [unclassified Apibacter]MXO34377.1 dTDP-4-dehydrorhamnose reductase [Apibacter sp. B3883]MXO41492.1 dTDP-4-dehydrorhamnose reductase [Apibacter sp. B3889]MXP03062.1 dTDP-4-dehydrorhamnose reductase [Apibacter sp. B3887]MXP07675.1 dTDP-4-dehydrorhamnose reductase [Apibacter sp. B3935]
MKKILITGGDGQLGRSLKQRIKDKPLVNYSFVFTDIQELDVLDEMFVKTYFFSNRFDYVINCAAYTAVDKAESDIEMAEKLNADAVKYLARASASQKATFIHISTDYVFSGEESTPRKEDDPVAPLGIYGQTKLNGEVFAQYYNPKTYIIRTSWLYSPYGVNFVKTMLKLFKEKDEINVIKDQIGSPTNALDLADAILTIIENDIGAYGIYNYSNEGECSWYQFSEEIKKINKSKIKINPILTSDYLTSAKRPKYSLLDKTKIKNTFGISIPDWKDSLKGMFIY